MSDETIRTIWVGIAGFFTYAVGFAQAILMVWWKASSEGRKAKHDFRTVCDRAEIRSSSKTVYTA